MLGTCHHSTTPFCLGVYNKNVDVSYHAQERVNA